MYETSSKQYASRHRLTWAARYPLKPGRDVASRRGLLVQIADTAISGEYWVSQEKLAERMGLTVRGLRMKLVKLCAEGALRARPRGYKQTTIYTLMRLDEVAHHGDFLPLNGDATSDRNSSSSQIGLTGTPVPLATGTPVPPKEAIVQEGIQQQEAAAAAVPSSRARAREAHENQPAAAAAADFVSDSSTTTDKRHTCPQCEKTWPKQFGPVCFACQYDVERAQRQQKATDEMLEEAERWDEAHPPAPPPPPAPPISQTARRLNLDRGGTLPKSWLYCPNLKTLMNGRDLEELRGIVAGIETFKLPAPEAFFANYAQHLQQYNREEAEIKAMQMTGCQMKDWQVKEAAA